MKFTPIIRLTDIPEDGKNFVWNRETSELNHALQDLLTDQKYEVHFFIKPVNSRDYMMTGTIKTQVPEDCSLCGMDFKLPITVGINEILIPPQTDERKGHYARVNHLSDADGNQGPQATEYAENQHFDMGEYVHEAIAIAIPFKVMPEADEKGDCRVCGLNQKTHNFSYDEKMEDEKPNPFAVLKGLKLN
jgi:uncharacterized protein